MVDPHIAAQQFFPTYTVDPKNKEIAIKEYEAATRTLESEERIFSGATGLAVLSLGFLGWLAAASYEEVVGKFSVFLGKSQVIGLLVLAVLAISLLAIIYFSELQRSLVHAARKIIVLRRILGVNYGRIELVLPSRRVEGADDPFSIRMFPGWSSYKCFPVYLITIVSAGFLILITGRYNVEAGQALANYGVPERVIGSGATPYFVTLFWVGLVLGTYRRKLADQHENILLCLARSVGFLTRISVVSAVEPVIYRARLAVFEAKRLKVNLDRFIPIILHLEDHRFYRHRGVSLSAIASAVWRFAQRGKRSGGSTITQQLARSLFLVRLRPAILRKPVEVVLAFWLERVFTKTDILELYLCSVRYDRDVLGVSAAIRHFFSRKPSEKLSTAEIFFLCERVANVQSAILPDRIATTAKELEAASLLKSDDLLKIISLYDNQIRAGRLSEKRSGAMDKLRQLMTR